MLSQQLIDKNAVSPNHPEEFPIVAGIFSSVARAYFFLVKLHIFRDLPHGHKTTVRIVLAHTPNSAFLRRSRRVLSSLLFAESSNLEVVFSGGFASKINVSTPL